MLTAAAVVVGSISLSFSPAGATPLATLKSQANAIYRQILQEQSAVGVLGQQYDQLQERYNTIRSQIANTEATVAADNALVAQRKDQLLREAIYAYVNSDAAAASNPLFGTSATNAGAQRVYTSIVEGSVQTTVAQLKNATITLTQDRDKLKSQRASAASAAASAHAAYAHAQAIQSSLQHRLNGLNGTIGRLVRAAQAAAAAAAAAEWARQHGGPTGSTNGFPVPPPNSRANLAIRFALSMLGVPYVWGGTSRRGVDCSGLTMLSWRAAGVYLPHYSGAQYNSTARVPLYALQPGDLLFYGRRGNEHVTMFIGRGLMIEAPQTGMRVRIIPVHLGRNFAGAGRVE